MITRSAFQEPNAEELCAQLKVGLDRKPELFYEYLFKNADVVLFVKDEHRFFIFHGIQSPTTNRYCLIFEPYL